MVRRTKSTAAPAAGPAPLALPAELTIYTVSELRPQWLSWLAAMEAAALADEVTVEAAAVSEVDAAGVQMLISLNAKLASRHQSMRVLSPSSTLVKACAELGVAALVEPRATAGVAA